MIGLQASGKSSFFLKNLYKTHIRLNMDMLKTRHRERILFKACLESKQPCVIDNTNPTRLERAKYIDLMKEYRFDVVGYYFKSSLKECLSRNSRREGKELIPEIGLRSTHSKLEIPERSEGFDHLYYVSINENRFSIEEWEEDEI